MARILRYRLPRPDRARDISAAAARGIDLPAEEKRAREESRKAAGRPGTVGDLLDEYVQRHCKPNQRKWKQTARLFEMHVRPWLGSRTLAELRRADIVELLDDLQNGKGLRAQVNRERAHIVAAFNWAIEREYLDSNPAGSVRKRRLETSRTRVLTDAELRAVWRACERQPEPGRAFVKVLILTGQRRDEVRCLPWSEIDLEQAVWILPANRNNKGKRDHEIPLCAAVLELLGEPGRPRAPVFTLHGDKPFSGRAPLKKALDQESGVTGWVFHDIRRTVASGMAALQVSQDTIDRVLNHAKPRLAGTYNRHQYLEEKRRALELWADHVALLVNEDPKVVVLHAGR